MDIFDKEKTVISCFDLTGNMVRPWAEAGYLCYCVDIQHPQGETRHPCRRGHARLAAAVPPHHLCRLLPTLHGCGRFRGTVVQGQGAVRAVPLPLLHHLPYHKKGNGFGKADLACNGAPHRHGAYPLRDS